MKFTILTTALAALLCTGTTTYAQLGVAKKVLPEVNLGVKVGANMQKMSSTYTAESFKPGILGGIFVGVSKKKMGVRVEGLIKSAKIESSLSSAPTIKTLMVDIPLMFQYSPVKRIKLHVGPQFTSILTAKDKNGTDVKSLLNSSDISAVAGVDVFLPLKLTVGARYIYGFTDLDKSSLTKLTSSSIQVSVGYRFLN